MNQPLPGSWQLRPKACKKPASKLLYCLLFLFAFTAIMHESIAQLNTAIDLSTYVRIGRYDLPEPTRTTAPTGNLLAQEASGVAYNWDTKTLFIVGDGGTSVTQVSKTGQLINTMTLGPGSSPQGTEFYDPEGITYIGNNQFVMTEERDRRLVRFTYAAGTTLTRANAQTVTLGTFVPNIGLEGVSWDPLTGGYILVKETQPMGIFQTNVDFAAGTATNGSPTTINSVNLFDPALTGMTDFADVFALSNIPGLAGLPNYSNLLVLSQENGKIVNISRTGVISSTLIIMSDPGNPLSVPDQQHEGLTMDENGILYVVSENGGGDFDHPQLWVYAPSAIPNQPPTAVVLQNAVTSILENSSTLSRIKVADILVTDDGLGTNKLYITWPDASFFEIIGSELFIKAGVVLDYETKAIYNITVNVDDVTVGTTPDASVAYTLNLIDVLNENPAVANMAITEVAPWSSGNSPIGADWFEVTNNSGTVLNITGWRMDDESNSFASSVALSGISTIAPGESVIFIETSTPATTIPAFRTLWFGANPPAGLQIGSYSGSGVGLSTGGDGVSLFNSTGVLQAKVSFGASPAGPYPTFDNGSGQNNVTLTKLSMPGVNGAFVAVNDASEIGSPGTIGKVIISEVAPWSSGNSPVGADWFEVTNLRAAPLNITGWKMDDNSFSFANAVALNGITSIAPGESVIFLETSTPATTIASFLSTWFGSNPPAGLQVGTYSGSGVGLSTGGDAVVLFNAAGVEQARVSFGASPTGPYPTFDNKAGLNNTTISQLSAVGINGAFAAINDPLEIGSPGVVGRLFISEVAPWSSGNSPVGADWFEVTNTTLNPISLTGWKMDDNSGSPAAAVPLSGISSIAPGESVIFIETSTPATTIPVFLSTWFGANPPANLQVGSYSGSGVGLSTGGDEVNLYNSFNQLQARVVFGTSSSAAPYRSFDNAAGINNALTSTLSQVGVSGAFIAVNDADEIGSPGTVTQVACGPITVTAVETTPIACNGGMAMVTVSAIGGQAPYTGTGTFTVGAGNYTYNISDAKGCTGTATISISAPALLVASSTAPAVACNGGTTVVTVSATGGTAPYTSTGTFTVGAGTYNYTVTDAKGCTAMTSITVGEPAVLAATATATPIVCNGSTTSVMVSATGGTAPYTGTGSFTETAGTYTYTVTDANGCSTAAMVTIAPAPVDPCMVMLSASKSYAPVSYNNASVTLCPAGTYKIPSVIQATIGSAGSEYAQLTYTTPDGKMITLLYQGISPVSTPKGNGNGGAGKIWKFDAAYLNYGMAGQTMLNLHQGNDFTATSLGLQVNGVAAFGTTSAEVVLTDKNCTTQFAGLPASKTAGVSDEATKQWSVDVLQNPSTDVFRIRVQSQDNLTPVILKVTDLHGKLMSNVKIAANSTISVGEARWSSGIYFAEVLQGGRRVVVRLVKSN